jgi:hypothetical protein
MSFFSRRSFLLSASAAALVPPDLAAHQSSTTTVEGLPPTFPAQPPELVQEMVGVSHGNVARVRALVAERPALARASWDWGYGDWETALGAASHVGNREIAEILLANGAHPTIFSAAMLGQLEVVRALVSASPGIQRTRGPHGINLLSHAKAGGAQSAAVVRYLESLGDAETRYPAEPLAAAAEELAGTYAFGPAPHDRFIVSVPPRGGLVIKREGAVDRVLSHHGGRVFNPAGAEAVRMRFTPDTGRATTVTIEDGPLRVVATRT